MGTIQTHAFASVKCGFSALAPAAPGATGDGVRAICRRLSRGAVGAGEQVDFRRLPRAGARPRPASCGPTSGESGRRLPVGRLAQLVLAPQPTVTCQLDRLVAKGRVQHIAHAGRERECQNAGSTMLHCAVR